jgi:hypothetical protein
MTIFKSVKKESHIRIAVLTVLIIVWTIGISLLISVLSPIDELVQNSPISLEDQSTIKSKIERLDIQSKITKEFATLNKDLSDDYREALKYLKEKFANFPNTQDGLVELISLIGSESQNPIIRAQFSSQVLGVSIHTVQEENKDNYVPQEIYLVSRDAIVEIKGKTAGMEYPESISYLSIQSAKSLLENQIQVDSTYREKRIVSIIEFSDPPSFKHLVNSYNGYRAKKLIELILFPEKGAKISLDLKNEAVIKNIFESILNNLARNERELSETYTKYSLLSEKMISTSEGLESRLLSSTALFGVISFRASLIVVVFVSIGFILIRALSAELAQARRISFTQIGNSMLTDQSVEKLQYAEQVISIVSGDNITQKSNQSDLPLASQLVEKTGEAISKVLTRSK